MSSDSASRDSSAGTSDAWGTSSASGPTGDAGAVQLRGADVVARRLYDAGCRFAFGIPGGEVLTLMDALSNAGVRFITVRHENAGGFMAEGTYHVTGAPGVVLATVGPGVANVVNAVANAQQDRVPLVVLTGCLDPSLTPTFTHQVFDHQAVLAPICKASFRLEAGAEALIVAKAICIATEGRPGPVHIDIPMAVAETRAEDMEAWPAVSSVSRVEIDRSELASFHRGRRPLMIIGNDVLHQRGTERVRTVADRVRIPVLTTYKAKGVVDEDADYALGAAGLSPKADGLLLPLVRRADAVLLVGYDAIEMRAGWRFPFSPDAEVIQLDAVADTQFIHRPTRRWVGEVATLLEEVVRDYAPHEPWPAGEPGCVRSDLAEAFDPLDDDDWSARVVTSILADLTREARVAVDTGAHRILASQMLCRATPGTLHQSTGLCTMGYALPAAIGAALAGSSRPVVAVVGDGGIEMVVGELATARDLGVSLTVVVYDDRSLALIEKKQRARKLANVGVDLGPDDAFVGTDYDAIARGFGARGVTVRSGAALHRELVASFERPGVDVITCRLSRRSYDDAI
ncbi:MAG: thiamine pyrophosphate-binding protein [Myxococcota bacterium]